MLILFNFSPLYRFSLFCFLFIYFISSCATLSSRQEIEETFPVTPGSYHLFDEVDGIPSEVLAETSPREDIFIRTMTGSPVPSEFAKAQTPLLVINPDMRASLAGDQHGDSGWSVNNFILFEILVNDRIVDRFTVGFHDPVHIGPEMIDSVGGFSPVFEARTPIITHRLPNNTPFILRATALDYRHIGAVSELWLLIEEGPGELDFRELRDD